MSWERINTKTTKCPCGKGIIKMDIYGDDWNRIEERTPTINCQECAQKYEITSEYFNPKPYHDYTIYYCLNKNNKDEKIRLDL